MSTENNLETINIDLIQELKSQGKYEEAHNLLHAYHKNLKEMMENGKIENRRIEIRVRQHKLKIQGRCIQCSKIKTEEDKNYKVCKTCREKIMKDKIKRKEIEKKIEYIIPTTIKQIVVDIDGTICSQETNYKKSKPNKIIISYLNKLYDQGKTIIYFTARGNTTGKNWEELTRKQLKKWNVKYTELKFGKPSADIYIDDKAINVKDILTNTTNWIYITSQQYL